MKPKTEEFLYFLLWSAELLTRPTFRNISESYEGWAYRNGLLRQVTSLEKARFLERAPEARDRLFRLTEAGRLRALGGRDPAIQWARQWDGRWRVVLFDVPQSMDTQREKLRRFLKDRSFGLLQRSVWISPDSLDNIRMELQGAIINVNALILLDARPAGGETDTQIVHGAWPLEEINEAYSDHMELLDKFPAGHLTDIAAAKNLQRWAASERASWLNAISKDPLLPEQLLPKDYLGRKAWRKRVQVLADAGDRIRSFRGN